MEKNTNIELEKGNSKIEFERIKTEEKYISSI